jgi:hypothetical protein
MALAVWWQWDGPGGVVALALADCNLPGLRVLSGLTEQQSLSCMPLGILTSSPCLLVHSRDATSASKACSCCISSGTSTSCCRSSSAPELLSSLSRLPRTVHMHPVLLRLQIWY